MTIMSINNDVDGDNDDTEVSDRVNFDYENSIYIYSDDNDNSVEVNDVTNVDGFDSDDDDYNDDNNVDGNDDHVFEDSPAILLPRRW